MMGCAYGTWPGGSIAGANCGAGISCEGAPAEVCSTPAAGGTPYMNACGAAEAGGNGIMAGIAPARTAAAACCPLCVGGAGCAIIGGSGPCAEGGRTGFTGESTGPG